MNPISALIFIVFIGGAVLSSLAQMPLAVTIVLALIGIFLGYSVKMAQQWERAVVLRLGKLYGVKGPAFSSWCRSSTRWRCGSTSASAPPKSMPSRR